MPTACELNFDVSKSLCLTLRFSFSSLFWVWTRCDCTERGSWVWFCACVKFCIVLTTDECLTSNEGRPRPFSSLYFSKVPTGVVEGVVRVGEVKPESLEATVSFPEIILIFFFQFFWKWRYKNSRDASHAFHYFLFREVSNYGHLLIHLKNPKYWNKNI